MSFLDGKLASDTIAGFKQKGIIKNFLADSLARERDVDVQQVVVEPMEKSPYQATVDFFEIEYSPADHSVVKRSLYTASFLFTFREHVPNEDILMNPLGLAITLFPGRRGLREMIRNSLFLSATALLLILFGLTSRLQFLAPWKRALVLPLWRQYRSLPGSLGFESLCRDAGRQSQNPAQRYRQEVVAFR